MQEEAAAGTPAGGVGVIAKAVAILGVLTTDGQATSAEIARRTGEPLSSVYRLLSSLEDIGWVEPGSRRGAHRLGAHFIGLAGRVEDGLDVRQAARPVLQRLHDVTGETAFLCIRRGGRAVCVERIDGARVQSLALRLGESLPLHVGAAPRALLAHEDEASWADYVRRTSPDGHHPPPALEALAEDLREVRSRGLAVSDGDVTDGIAALGAPVFDHRGHVVAALSLSGLRQSVLDPAQDARALVLEGAAEVSALLGHQTTPRPTSA